MRAGRALDALREAMAPEALPSAPPRPTRAALAALADNLDNLVALSRGAGGLDRSAGITACLEEAAAIVRASSVHGYPRPALELLGAQASAVPNARTSDPVTAKRAGDDAHVVPSATNHLGRLLVAVVELGDGGATSEEAAVHAGIPLTAEYAKRVSVLERLGYVTPWRHDGAVITRKGRAGRDRQVYVATADGLRLARAIVLLAD